MAYNPKPELKIISTAHLWKHGVAKLESTTNDVMTVQLQYPIEFGVAAIFA